MFAKLKGIIDSTSDNQIIIDVNGVGYLVAASRQTINRLPPSGQMASLIIETRVREDAIQLFGFIDEQERDLFRLLQTIQGIGGKAALAILSALNASELTAAIASGDKAMVAKADGVGPKLALRVVTELKDKISKLPVHGFSISAGTPSAAPTNNNNLPLRHSEDAISALVNLGYQRADAFRVVAQLSRTLDAETPVQKIIPAALRELAA